MDDSFSPGPTVTLLDGHRMPSVGFGTYPLRGSDAVSAVSRAIASGYRLLDTAVHYGNEVDVGQAIKDSGVPRPDLFVVSKLPGRDHSYQDAIASTRASLDRLAVDYLDMHLIHWPNPQVGLFVEAWHALIDLQSNGLIRSIGVSNFTAQHLERIIDTTGVIPAVNQIEMHPFFQQEELRRTHEELAITTIAWSPLGRGLARLETSPAIVAAAKRCEVTPAQAVLRWHVQSGSVPIPKSANPERQRNNLDLLRFELTSDEMVAIASLGHVDGRTGGNPVTHLEM